MLLTLNYLVSLGIQYPSLGLSTGALPLGNITPSQCSPSDSDPATLPSSSNRKDDPTIYSLSLPRAFKLKYKLSLCFVGLYGVVARDLD